MIKAHLFAIKIFTLAAVIGSTVTVALLNVPPVYLGIGVTLIVCGFLYKLLYEIGKGDE
jgi:hypothetical protein